MKKTKQVAKATPKKKATKKVVQRTVGKIEINYINHGDDADATMNVWGMTRKEVLNCLKNVAINLAEDILRDSVSDSVKDYLLKKEAPTKKAPTKKALTKWAVAKKITPKKTTTKKTTTKKTK